MKPEPKATQVFISHTYEERAVAAVLQKYIRSAFKGSFPVFAAFDRDSIGGGRKWFNHIVESLHKSVVVLVLVSHESRRQPWVNFEAGYGGGVEAEVIPVSVRNFSLGTLDFPLAGFQGRSIDDLPGILADITHRVLATSSRPDMITYLREIHEAEAQLIYKSLTVRPVVLDKTLRFELTNKGNTDIELLMLEVLVPTRYVDRTWPAGASDLFHFERVRRRDEDYMWFACTSNRGAFGMKKPILRPFLTPAMGTITARDMQIPLSPEKLDFPQMHFLIYYQIHAVDFPTDMEEISWAQLDFH